MKLDFADILTIVFVVLKLTGVISWSWWFVFAPVLVQLGVLLLVLIIVGVAVMVDR